MGPRKFGVVKKRSSKNWVPSSQERRTKGRQEESTPRPLVAPSSSVPPPPSSFASRVVTTGRKINFDFLEREGFTIGRAITLHGWDFMCSIDLPTYPALVREFYENLGRGAGGFVSTVRGTEVRLTEQLLARILRLRREEAAPSVHEDREAILRLILQREDVNELTVVSANQLSAEMRLLHNIIGRIFFPKIGRFDFISERDLVMMHCILEGIAVNLPRMMMVYIGEAIQKTKTSLPYGMYLTLIFREHGVQIPEGETAIRLRHTDFYSEKSLMRMGCEKKDGRWIRKGGEQRPAEQGEPIVRDDPIPGSPPASPTHSAAGPTASPVPPSVPSPPAQSAPPETHMDDDQLRSLARMVAEETAARVQSVMASAVERFELSMGRLEHLLETHTSTQGERISELFSELRRFTSRQDQHFRGPPAQPETSSSQPAPPAAAATVPERQISSAAPTISALPPRPPRPTILRSGPASRTRSRTPARSSDSPPSVHLPDTRNLRVYSRSSHRRVTGPIDIPSE